QLLGAREIGAERLRVELTVGVELGDGDREAHTSHRIRRPRGAPAAPDPAPRFGYRGRVTAVSQAASGPAGGAGAPRGAAARPLVVTRYRAYSRGDGGR